MTVISYTLKVMTYWRHNLNSLPLAASFDTFSLYRIQQQQNCRRNTTWAYSAKGTVCRQMVKTALQNLRTDVTSSHLYWLQLYENFSFSLQLIGSVSSVIWEFSECSFSLCSNGRVTRCSSLPRLDIFFIFCNGPIDFSKTQSDPQSNTLGLKMGESKPIDISKHLGHEGVKTTAILSMLLLMKEY